MSIAPIGAEVNVKLDAVRTVLGSAITIKGAGPADVALANPSVIVRNEGYLRTACRDSVECPIS
jgi:hypothetical protein